MQTDKIKKSKKNEFSQIVYSRIKITRNIADYNFANTLPETEKLRLENKLVNYIKNNIKGTDVFDLQNIDKDTRKIFLDENLVEKSFLIRKKGRFIFLPDKKIAITLNHFDHINAVCVKPNYDLKRTYNELYGVVEKIESEFNFAASTKYGYLTSDIFNCGLGIKLFVLIHLPGIQLVEGKKDEVFKMYKDRGYSISPWRYKKDEKTDYFLFSTKLNFGVTEYDLIERFLSGIKDLIQIEDDSLRNYFVKNKDDLIDNIYRSLGIVSYSKKMDYQEAFTHLSNLRLGIKMCKNLNISYENLNKLFIKIKDGYVNKLSKNNNEKKEITISNVIKSYLNMESINVSQRIYCKS